ncbi:MAG: rod shape-determining protein RodA [Gammaproteobacteria bacterium]|nr:rod shape-determining protein RodA [Gammaproteobacteria bacterium]MDH5778467.1 rod shape-determining protein RodA [Gammaproteobacteria bacterium]
MSPSQLSSSDFGDSPRISGGSRLLESFHLDVPLLVALLTLAGIGLIVMYSAGSQDGGLILRQILRLLLGFLVMFGIAQIHPTTLSLWAPWIFGAGLLMLVAVLLLGEVGKGAQRWLNLGLFSFQPSEIMKIALPMMIASFLADSVLPPRRLRLLMCSLILVVPTLLVAKQPDLGTALLIAASGIFALFLAGLRWKLIIFLVASVSACIPFIWNALHDYQRQRVLTFLNPENDPLGAGYHIIQSTIAIGSGGVYGKGWLNGTQSHLDFLPERSTDFIFAVFSEEFGFIGVILLLSIYLFITARGLLIASQAQDTFTRLLAGSLTLTFFIYIFINMGMVSGLVPVVGVPLPLVSYGGTSLVTIMAGFGILMSIKTNRKLVGH